MSNIPSGTWSVRLPLTGHHAHEMSLNVNSYAI